MAALVVNPPTGAGRAVSNRAVSAIVGMVKDRAGEFQFSGEDSFTDSAKAISTGAGGAALGGVAGGLGAAAVVGSGGAAATTTVVAAATAGEVAAAGVAIETAGAAAGTAGAVIGGFAVLGAAVALAVASPLILACKRVKTRVHIATDKKLVNGRLYHDSGKTSDEGPFPTEIDAGTETDFYVLNCGGSACGACGMAVWRVQGTKKYVYILWDNSYVRSLNDLHVACGVSKDKMELGKEHFNAVLGLAGPKPEDVATDVRGCWSCKRFGESKNYQWVTKTACGLETAGLMTSTRENHAFFAISVPAPVYSAAVAAAVSTIRSSVERDNSFDNNILSHRLGNLRS